MKYYIDRGGQRYGPYTLADLQRMLSQGQVLPTDPVWGEGMTQWTTVQQVVGSIPAPAPAPAFSQPSFGGGMGTPANNGLVPPSMHWAILLLLGLVTCGLIFIVWMFVQALFVRKLRPNNPAVIFYGLYLLMYLGIFGFSFAAGVLAATGGGRTEALAGLNMLLLLVELVGAVVFQIGNFKMKDALEDYYTSEENIGLRLSGVMVFFFNILYFQYWFSRIANWKRTGAPI